MRASHMLAVLLVVAAVCPFARSVAPTDDPSDPPWDHQEKTYHVSFKPTKVEKADGDVALFFSPDESTSFLTDLVESAEHTVDVGTPGFSSWVGCTYGGGCSVDEQRFNETFPIFPALLNALSAGVHVRILTNDYGATPPAHGNIDPLTFLFLAGAEVKYYASTTFWHAKYIAVDGGTHRATSAFSSINFSQTSFRKNREAGLSFAGDDFVPILDAAARVFDADWDAAVAFVPAQTYTAAQLRIIRSRAHVPVVIPPPVPFPGSHFAPTTRVSVRDASVELLVSPDYAYETLKAALDAAAHTFTLYIYQVTDTDLCEWLKDFGARSDRELRILVSYAIFDYTDYELARGCYRDLVDAGVDVRSTHAHMYSFSHQKYWVVDNATLWLSTGNWSPSDFPYYTSPDFPAYNATKDHAGWIQANRDFTVAIDDPTVVDAALAVFDADYWIGSPWSDE